MPTLPQANEPHEVPTKYWKVVANDAGNVTAFIFDQGTPTSATYCDQRKPLSEVEMQSGLKLFPRASGWPTGNLDTKLGC